MNMLRFGNPLESGYGADAHRFLPFQLWHMIPQLLGSLDKGLLVFCPILILGVLGWKEFASRYQWEAILCGGLILGNLVLAGAWPWWEGGWSWGPRYLVPAIPFWLLPAALWFERRRSRVRFWVLVLLSSTSMVAQIPGVLVTSLGLRPILREIMRVSFKALENFNCLVPIKLIEAAKSLRR